MPSAARPSQEHPNRGGDYYDDSRRNSYADSIASSQYTTESRLPPGQRRLEDGMPADYQPSRASSEYQVSTHHHSLQNRQVSQLRNTSPTNSAQPYSRTPELRVSHKLAERKRRTEMKDLFDTLRNTQGVERGAKASKWEILTKGKQRKKSPKRNQVASPPYDFIMRILRNIKAASQLHSTEERQTLTCPCTSHL